MYKVTIDDVAELTQEVSRVCFATAVSADSRERTSDCVTTLTIEGVVAFDSEKTFMKDSVKKLAEWSLVDPTNANPNRTVSVEFNHAGAIRKYKLTHAFVVSFEERFEDQNGFFKLVLQQSNDKPEGICIE